MKRLLLLLIFCLSIITSCKDKNEISNTGKILQGKHELRKFKTQTKEGRRWSASYFLIGGSASGGTYSDKKASFSWKMNTGEYAISEIEIGKIRVRINDSVKTPYVNFGWEKSSSTDLESIFLWHLNYMVITCNEKDYPININIDQL